MPTPTSWSPVESTTLLGNNTDFLLRPEFHFASGDLTFSFGTSRSSWSTSATTGYGSTSGNGEPFVPGYEELTAKHQQSVRIALNTWERYADLQFTEVTDTLSNVGDLRFAYSDLDPTAQAWAYYPANAAFGGDVWFNTLYGNYTEVHWGKGSYEYNVALHEIGHALGLSHPFEGDPSLVSGLDSRSYTIMSYSAGPGQGGYFSYEPTTPMVLDIQAIQHLYGANTTHNDDDTTYTYTEKGNYHETIWDSGGMDTLVYKGGSSSNVLIDLREGYNFGSRMGRPIKIYNEEDEMSGHVKQNVFIAFGSVIENAVGSNEASDIIYGNSANNKLKGLAGNDKLYGGSGSDLLLGGSGQDKLAGGLDGDFFRVASRSGFDTIKDFTSADGDIIQLENSAFSILGAPGALSSANFRANASGTAVDANDYIIYDTTDGKLYFDGDGDGGGARVQIALIGVSTHAALTAADFEIV